MKRYVASNDTLYRGLTMNNTNLIGQWIRRFLLEYSVRERNLAHNTQVSYRDTLTLLLPFSAKWCKKPVDQLSIDDISPELIRSFLLHLEEDRGCSVATRNQRLATIHSLAYFIGSRSPQYLAWCTEIRAIPLKKTSKPVMCYLEKTEMDALLDAPDRKSRQGYRDYALLLFLYNSGARATEAACVTIADLNIDNSTASVRIVGKAGKVRHCPLWSLTCKVLTPLVSRRAPNEPIFLNRRAQPITRSGIYALVKRSAINASHRVVSIKKKKVGPHTIRHTTAVFLLRAGVDINTIRAWLGHVRIDTTNIYAEVDLEMKANALSHCEIMTLAPVKKQWQERSIMEFLKTL